MKPMKTKLTIIKWSALFGLALLAGVYQVIAQLPVISSFSQNGALVCTNLQPGSTASVQWSSSLSGPWTNWAGAACMDNVTVNSNGTISVSVPMFYRVCGQAYITNYPEFTADGMALIPAGSFTMGDTLDGEGDAIPTNVYVSAFYMDTNLVSYSQWQSVYNWATGYGFAFDNAGSAQTINQPVQPVEMVNWYDVVKWCNARSQRAGLTPVYYTDAGLTQVYTSGDTDAVYVNWAATGYRLPTEAEWEKAARGRLSGQRFPWGDTISEGQANYDADPNPPNSHGYTYDLGPYTGYNTNFDTGGIPYTSPVGSFTPNGYGLCDMAGNLLVWCWDWYGIPYGQPTANNPTGPTTVTDRVLRSGAWFFDASDAHCASRGYTAPSHGTDFIGFRCVRGL